MILLLLQLLGAYILTSVVCVIAARVLNNLESADTHVPIEMCLIPFINGATLVALVIVLAYEVVRTSEFFKALDKWYNSK